jgi:hypothetical protein
VRAVISVTVILLLVFSFLPFFLFMVQCIVAIPLDLYFLVSGEDLTVPSANDTGKWMLGAIEAYLFPKRSKLGFLVLLVVAIFGAAIAWDIVLGA